MNQNPHFFHYLITDIMFSKSSQILHFTVSIITFSPGLKSLIFLVFNIAPHQRHLFIIFMVSNIIVVVVFKPCYSTRKNLIIGTLTDHFLVFRDFMNKIVFND